MELRSDDIKQLVGECSHRIISEIKRQSTQPDLKKTRDQDVTLDSMGMLMLLIEIEEEIDRKYGTRLTLSSEELLDCAANPLKKKDKISNIIFHKLQKVAHA